MIDNRTGLQIIDRDDCLRLLATHTSGIGRLALIEGSHPVILPINYALDQDHVVFRTAAGTKLDGALRGAAVAFEIDHVDEATHTGWSVLVKGHAESVVTHNDVLRLKALPLRPWADGEHANWVSIRPEMISGRKVTGGNGFFW